MKNYMVCREIYFHKLKIKTFNLIFSLILKEKMLYINYVQSIKYNNIKNVVKLGYQLTAKLYVLKLGDE